MRTASLALCAAIMFVVFLYVLLLPEEPHVIGSYEDEIRQARELANTAFYSEVLDAVEALNEKVESLR